MHYGHFTLTNRRRSMETWIYFTNLAPNLSPIDKPLNKLVVHWSVLFYLPFWWHTCNPVANRSVDHWWPTWQSGQNSYNLCTNGRLLTIVVFGPSLLLSCWYWYWQSTWSLPIHRVSNSSNNFCQHKAVTLRCTISVCIFVALFCYDLVPTSICKHCHTFSSK